MTLSHKKGRDYEENIESSNNNNKFNFNNYKYSNFFMQTITKEEVFAFYYRYGMWWYMPFSVWERKYFELNPQHKYKTETLEDKSEKISKKLNVNKEEVLKYFYSLV